MGLFLCRAECISSSQRFAFWKEKTKNRSNFRSVINIMFETLSAQYYSAILMMKGRRYSVESQLSSQTELYKSWKVMNQPTWEKIRIWTEFTDLYNRLFDQVSLIKRVSAPPWWVVHGCRLPFHYGARNGGGLSWGTLSGLKNYNWQRFRLRWYLSQTNLLFLNIIRGKVCVSYTRFPYQCFASWMFFGSNFPPLFSTHKTNTALSYAYLHIIKKLAFAQNVHSRPKNNTVWNIQVQMETFFFS